MKTIMLCGGNGTRLWPISRENYPKPFCDIGLDQSLFKQTVHRNSPLCDDVVVVTNKAHHFLVTNQIDDLNITNYRVILEPIGRNTAPAIALACLLYNEEDIILVSPSDHIIHDQTVYIEAIQNAKKLAQKDKIVTFGIIPSYPETGYGYITDNQSHIQ